MGRSVKRQFDATAAAALAPLVALAPVCMLSLAVFWLVARIWWNVGYLPFAGFYLAAGITLFLRPVQRYVLGPLLGARTPTREEAVRLDTAWRGVLQRNGLFRNRYVMMVLPSDELNAFACGGHLVIVTSYAVDYLPRNELAGVLAHELSHHLGLHTFALTVGHWLSLPTLVLARIGFFLRNVASAATASFARSSASLTVLGRVASGLLMAVSWVFLAGLLLSKAIANTVGRRAEFQADRRAVDMGFGKDLASALRRVLDEYGTEGAGTSHPSARMRIARIDKVVRERRPARAHRWARLRPNPDADVRPHR